MITGAGGFIGSHLVELCCENNLDVRAFVRYNSKNSWGWLESSPYKNEMEVISGDIRDYDSVRKAVKGCTTVFHLAALIGIPYSYVSPIAYVKTNIEGTYNILEAAKTERCENILITSTSETYGSAQYVPIDEKHPMVGQSPYSATKIGADHLALSYYRSFDLPVKIVRPFNTFGPRQSARAVIPTTITQILAGNKELKLGNTEPTRDLTFVKDTAQGFMEIARSQELLGEITNIGMSREISIGDLVALIAELMQTEVIVGTERERVRPDKSEVLRLLCDNSKLLSKTKWRPAYDLRSGLLETIDWLKKNKHLYKSDIYNV
ncbi:MAG TPA: NAD-dependent epimerase/dehydratase family protein [Calditrichaeota bacterium]|nr:NAD-dependent epimerase/dehydratase family protein [Calditrichota bacterium]